MPRRQSVNKKTLRKISGLQDRLAVAEETLNAIRIGEVDALVVHTPHGEQLFTLKGADQTYRALVEAMSEGALTVQNGVISYCNSHFAKMARTPLENVIGASVFDFVRSGNFRDLVEQLQSGGATRGSIEATLCRRDGQETPVLLSGSRFYSDDKPAIGMVITDIAKHKEAEKMRQVLARSVLTAQEQERQRVARDLHDGVSQLLASAKYRLHSIAAEPGSPNANGLAQVLGLVERAIGEVLLISRNLRPAELDDLGLAAALRTLAQEFENRSGITARIKNIGHLPGKRFEREIEMTLYRIVQESLNNVEKHSKADRVTLALNTSKEGVIVTIRDNGKGVPENRRNGSGVQNMIERAAMLGGRVEMQSEHGMGTQITAWIPMPKSPKKIAKPYARSS
jgi:PAS domain S-box-containing protein